jgi:hypothetical protein
VPAVVNIVRWIRILAACGNRHLHPGDHNCEYGALAFFTSNRNVAAVSLHIPLCYREPQTRSARATGPAFLHTIKAVEQSG